MTTTRNLILATLFAAACGSSSKSVVRGNAPIAPDFVASAPAAHIDRSLVASNVAMNRIEPLDVVAFNFDSDTLTSEGFTQVDRAARWLSTHPRHRIVLEGHADAVGESEYNHHLAMRRAEAISARLRANGIGLDRIVVLSFGESESMVGDTERRRVVLHATQLPVRDVLAMHSEYRQPIVASWNERGTRLSMTIASGEQPTGVISRR